MRKSLLSKFPVLTFFIFTFIISWGAILIFFGANAIPATQDIQKQLGMAILLGPSISSLLLIAYLTGTKGLQQLWAKLTRWRANMRWYLVAVLLAPLSTIICLAVLSLFVSDYVPAILDSSEGLNVLLLGLIGGVIVGLLEELGWSGFAVPRLLRRYNIFITGAIVGAVWGAWHFILFWEDNSFVQTLPFLLLIARLFAWLPAYRIIMVWVYDRTQSLLIMILMHASLVASLAILDPVINGKELLIYIVIRAVILWSIVAIISIIGKRKTIDIATN